MTYSSSSACNFAKKVGFGEKLNTGWVLLSHQFFLNFGMVLKTHMKLCVTEPDFLERNILPQKLLKMNQKLGFLKANEKFGH